MSTMREWIDRLLGTLGLRRPDSDLESEMRAHLELAAEDARQRGTADDVIRMARLRAGGIRGIRRRDGTKPRPS